MIPATLAKAYDITPLRAQGITGTGQTVAVISFDSFENTDLSSFESRFGITGPAVQHVEVHGGALPGAGQQEVNLDIDTIRSIAPGAQILDYEAPQGSTTDADVINQIVADHRARVISSSWGRCDLLVSPAERAADETALAAARAAGITVFAASGDNGAYDCQAEDLSDQRVSVDWPAASANVVAVGGTRLAVRQDGSYLAEYGWEDVLKGDGSGGGLASATPRPAWQTGPGVQNSFSNGLRQLPDVAGPADPDSGMVVVSGGATHQVGGTSAAAPFWAATMLLLRQYAAAARRPRPRLRRARAVRDRREPAVECVSPRGPGRQPALQRDGRLELRRRTRIAGRRGARPRADARTLTTSGPRRRRPRRWRRGGWFDGPGAPPTFEAPPTGTPDRPRRLTRPDRPTRAAHSALPKGSAASERRSRVSRGTDRAPA